MDEFVKSECVNLNLQRYRLHANSESSVIPFQHPNDHCIKASASSIVTSFSEPDAESEVRALSN